MALAVGGRRVTCCTSPTVYGLCTTVQSEAPVVGEVLAVAELECVVDAQADLLGSVHEEQRLTASVAHIRDLVVGIAEVAGDGGVAPSEEALPSTVSYRIAIGDETLAIDPDPKWIAAQNVSDATAWRIMHQQRFDLPSGASADKIDVVLLWATQTGGPGQTGTTKWAVSREVEAVGLPPTEADDITAEFAASDARRKHATSGVAPRATLGAGAFTIMLLGRPSAPGHTLSADVSDESEAIVTMHS